MIDIVTSLWVAALLIFVLRSTRLPTWGWFDWLISTAVLWLAIVLLVGVLSD